MPKDKQLTSNCIAEASETLREYFKDFVIVATPKDRPDNISVVHYGSAPHALHLLESGQERISGKLKP